MATLSAIREAIGAALRTIPGLVVSANIAAISNLGDGGGAVVGGPTADYDGAMARGMVTWNVPIYVLAPASNYDRATQILDDLVSPSGPRSVRELVWNTGRASQGGFGVTDANGDVDVDARISTLTAYGIELPNAGISHLAAVMNCVVLSSGGSR